MPRVQRVALGQAEVRGGGRRPVSPPTPHSPLVGEVHTQQRRLPLGSLVLGPHHQQVPHPPRPH